MSMNTKSLCKTYDARGNGNGNVSCTITGNHQSFISDYTAIVVQSATYKKTSHPKSKEDGQGWTETEVNDTLNIYDNGEIRTPTLVVENKTIRIGNGQDDNATMLNEEVSKRVWDWHRCDTRMTELKDICNTASASWGAGGNNMPYVEENAIVRRLTPLECERLQGYPDFWTSIGEWVDSKGKKHKEADSNRYKALGNSIGLPYWEWMANKIVKQLNTDGVENPTMASLFDGIGGFPLVYSRAGCKPVWASEIEEFPIAVTKIRFPEGEDE